MAKSHLKPKIWVECADKSSAMTYLLSMISDSKSLWVFIICVAGTVMGSTLLYHEMHVNSSVTGGPPWGTVESVDSRVSRKSATSYAWRDAEPLDEIYLRDSVRTGNASAAILRLNDGSRLEIGENSLVVIDRTLDLPLQFLKGSFVLKKKDEDHRVEIDSHGKAKIRILPAQLISPETGTKFFVAYHSMTNATDQVVDQAKKKIHFAWNLRKKAEKIIHDLALEAELQLSVNQSFPPQNTKIVPKVNENYDIDLGPGQYYWRVYAKGQPLTEKGKFQILRALPLTPSWPNGNEKVFIWGDRYPVQFRWVAPTRVAKTAQFHMGIHRIEIASDADFKSPLISERVPAGVDFTKVKGLPSGYLYWRIKSQYGDVSIESNPERFEIEKQKEFVVNLVKPEVGANFETLPQLPFTWSLGEGDISFLWELENLESHFITSFEGSASNYIWRNPAPGKYRWRVLAKHKDLNVGKSEWRSFTVYKGKPVALKTPTLGEVFHYWEKIPEYSFSWEPDSLAHESPGCKYRVEVAKERFFKDVLYRETNNESISSDEFKLSSGHYFWRVQVVDPIGTVLKSSAASRFSLSVFPLLESPTQAFPQPGVVYDALKEEKDPAARWSPVPDAQEYEVTLLNDSDVRVPAEQRILIKKRTSNAELEFGELKAGKYLWSVRAVDRLSRPGKELPYRLLVISRGRKLAAPRDLTSEVQ